MASVDEGLQQLMEGLKRAGIEAVVAPASKAELAEVREVIPLSAELEAWYRKAAPRKDIDFEWGAVTLFIHGLPGLVEWQEGYRWEAGSRDRLDPEWKPQWVAIANWDGDPAIADTSKPETPIYTAMHGEGTWEPKPIAPNLGAFLAAVGIWAEVVHGRFQGDITDEEFEMRADVRKVLDAALEPILETKYRRRWLKFD